MSILLNRLGGILTACGFCLELASGFRAVAGVVVCRGIGALSVLFIARFVGRLCCLLLGGLLTTAVLIDGLPMGVLLMEGSPCLCVLARNGR